MAREVTDLPEPDSPTIPRVRPGSRSKSMPRTACTTPFSVVEADVQVADGQDGVAGGVQPCHAQALHG